LNESCTSLPTEYHLFITLNHLEGQQACNKYKKYVRRSLLLLEEGQETILNLEAQQERRNSNS